MNEENRAAASRVSASRKEKAMRLPFKPGHLPQRIAAGAFILNSGIGKLSADEETAAQLHGFAVGAYPFLAKLKPQDFVRLLGVCEVALGSALVLPFVPSAVAGAGLTAFSGGLLGQYARHAQGKQPLPDAAGDRAGQGRVDDGHRARPGHRRPHRSPRQGRLGPIFASARGRTPWRDRYAVEVAGQHYLTAERRRGLGG